MKKILTSASVVTAFLMTLTASADVTTGCRFKQQDIERDLEHARQYNNTSSVNGLEKALQENREHCNDATLLHELQLRVEEKKQKLADREQALLEAEQEARTGKLTKLKRKTEEARAELNDALKDLRQYLP